MIKKMMTLGFLFLTLISFAQEIDIKRGEILMDEKPIALIDKEKRGVYTISTLEEVPKLMVAYKGMGFPNGEVKYWYEITSLGTDKMNEIPYKKLTSSIGMKMNLAANLIKGDYPILTSDGIDEALLKKFTEGTSTGVLAGYKQKRQQLLNEKNKTEASLKEIRAALNIDKIGNVYFKTGKIGKIVQANKSVSGKNYFRYVVYDLDNNKIAEYIAEIDLNDFFDKFQSSEIITIDGKKFPYEWEDTMKTGIENDPNTENVIATLRLHGYELGHQMKKAILAQKKKETQKRLEAKKARLAAKKAKARLATKKAEKLKALTPSQTEKMEILTSLVKPYAYFNLVSSNDLSDASFVLLNLKFTGRVSKKAKSKVKENKKLFKESELNSIVDYLEAYSILEEAEIGVKLTASANRNSSKNRMLFSKMDAVFKESLLNIIKNDLKGQETDIDEFVLLTKVDLISNESPIFVKSSIETYRHILLNALNSLVNNYDHKELKDYLNNVDENYKKQRRESETEKNIENLNDHYHKNTHKLIEQAILNLLVI